MDRSSIAGNTKKTPYAFVIMPFDEELSDIYSSVVRPTILECGLDVRRADDLGTYQNVIGDIVTGINDASIIIADLTKVQGQYNANVYYELGLAHALNKPVILLAQRTDHVPFDLAAYRLITYSTHYKHMETALNELRLAIRSFVAGDLVLGSPISDHLRKEVELPEPTGSITRSDSREELVEPDERKDEPGLYDLFAEAEERMNQMNVDVNSMADRIGALSRGMKTSLDKIQGSKSTSAKRRAIREFASEVDDVANGLDSDVSRYRSHITVFRDSLERAIQGVDIGQVGNLEALKELEPTFAVLEAQIEYGLNSTYQLRASWRNMANFEVNLTRAGKHLVGSLDHVIDAFGQHKTTIGRLRLVINRQLDTGSEGDAPGYVMPAED